MRKNLKALLLLVVMIAISMPIKAVGTFVNYNSDGFVWIANGKALPILVDEQEDKGVMRAVNNLLNDANAVTGITPQLIYTPNGQQALIIGTIESQWTMHRTHSVHRRNILRALDYYAIKVNS